MKKIIDTLLKQRMFFIFLLLAAVLWYISRLSHDYTTKIPLVIELSTDSRSEYWIENPQLSINVTAEGDGRVLSLYLLGLKRNLVIESSQLIFSPTDKPYEFTINANSLARAIAKREPSLSVLNIEDTTLTVRLSKLATQRLPVENRLYIHCRRQYMVVGDISLSLDSVDVKAPQMILDTLKFIPTETILFDGVSSNIEGKAKLQFSDNVFCAKSFVNFSAEIAGFTEMQFELPIRVTNVPSNKSTLVVPSTTVVKLQVPLDKFTLDISPVASINFTADYNANRLVVVSIDSLPRWAEIVSIQPKFVELLFLNNND